MHSAVIIVTKLSGRGMQHAWEGEKAVQKTVTL